VDLVPFGDDAGRIDRARCRPVVQARYVVQAMVKIGRVLIDGLTPILNSIAEGWDTMVIGFARAGLIPPPASSLKHGTVWTSPLDGSRVRVRGRRGRPQTFHWGPP